jgi:hypothetical protein
MSEEDLPQLPRFPILMFLFALMKSFADALFDLISLIPFIGWLLGPTGDLVTDCVFYSVFFLWKLMHRGTDSEKLSLGKYAIRAAIGWLFGSIYLLNLFDAPLTVILTWRAERKKVMQQRTAMMAQGAGDNDLATDGYPIEADMYPEELPEAA